MKPVITKEDVASAIKELVAQQRKPTLNAIHTALGHRGSMSTVVKFKAELDATALPVTDSETGLQAFREMWALAVDEGRKQQEGTIVELREALQTLAMENERLDVATATAQDRASEVQKAKAELEAEMAHTKTRLEAQLTDAQAAALESTAKAADALNELAQAQARHATEIAALRSLLDSTVQKAHALEIELARSQATLEAKALKTAKV